MRFFKNNLHASLSLSAVTLLLLVAAAAAPSPAPPLPTETLAVIVSGSRYAFNYRHSAGALAVYSLLRQRGVPDERIVLMLAEDHAQRLGGNPFLGAMFLQPDAHEREAGAGAARRRRRRQQQQETQGSDVVLPSSLLRRRRSARRALSPGAAAVDYRGPDVSAAAVLAVLAQRHAPGTPARQRLPVLAGGGAHLLLYMTGHGGDGFLKLSDADELDAGDVAAVLAARLRSGAFASVTALFDTCQAATLHEHWRTPGALALASSRRAQDSLSYAGIDAAGTGHILGDGFSTLLWLHMAGLPPPQLSPEGGRASAYAHARPRNITLASPTPLRGGGLSLTDAVTLARGAAAALNKQGVLGAGGKEERRDTPALLVPPTATLAELAAAIPSSSIGSSVAAHGTASLRFYAAIAEKLSSQQQQQQHALADDDAAGHASLLVSALLAAAEPGASADTSCLEQQPVCSSVARAWLDTGAPPAGSESVAKSLGEFIASTFACAGELVKGRGVSSHANWWSTILSASDTSRCRDRLAELSACLAVCFESPRVAHKLAASSATGSPYAGSAASTPLLHALFRSHPIDAVFGGT